MSLSLTLDYQYKTTIPKLWSALTDPGKLEKWVLPNNFKPIEGHRFQFRNEPNPFWDGIIDGEVLLVDEPRKLSYSWAVGEEKHVVTWTIRDLGDGHVNLHLEQTGITNEQGLAGAKHGWTQWCGQLNEVLAA
ncbi:SRPBCC domain-containing protein [Paenibacillus sp. IB182496]|uniref:SRPBCC domain-containing protein n=1 Tax=Paenibacillus sabuli TaxID=2772509 RepID=A0A927GRA2_9BACL|nr:SRPBCC domain-containing protein [Paenibacillus sabuli]MBD2845414.1 SRPBCC domain-containing protein [Paenibacillus sabuli]